MEVEIKDFTGVFKNAFTKEFCDFCIDTYRNAEKCGFTITRQQHTNAPKINKDTNSFFIAADTFYDFLHTARLAGEFGRIFWNDIYPLYKQKYSVFETMDPHNYYQLKMQKTEIGGGYHIWHQENNANTSKRIIIFILYLNDVHEGGETELLYYGRRIKPEAGTLLIMPSGYTHTHRGNPPISNEKYILNGWLEF